MNKKRLLKLADFLETVKPKEFRMDSWYNETPCGTTACAFGWACSIPSFKRAGLKMKVIRHTDVAYGDVTFKGLESYNAASKFFGIDIDEAEYLFSPDAYSGKGIKRQVIRRIRKLCSSR